MLTPIATRLTQGIDLKAAIEQLVSLHKIQAGSIASCVGCLSTVNLRLAGAQKTLQLNEPLEIVSLMGTLTANHQHIHISVAHANGNVVGGHLLEGSLIDTTAELIIHHYTALEFTRAQDESTGYTELIVNNKKRP